MRNFNGQNAMRAFHLFRVLSRDPDVLELEWAQPTQTYGNLLGYRIRYGIKNQTFKEEFIEGTHQRTYKIDDLGKRRDLALFKLVNLLRVEQ